MLFNCMVSVQCTLLPGFISKVSRSVPSRRCNIGNLPSLISPQTSNDLATFTSVSIQETAVSSLSSTDFTGSCTGDCRSHLSSSLAQKTHGKSSYTSPRRSNLFRRREKSNGCRRCIQTQPIWSAHRADADSRRNPKAAVVAADSLSKATVGT